MVEKLVVCTWYKFNSLFALQPLCQTACEKNKMFVLSPATNSVVEEV